MNIHFKLKYDGETHITQFEQLSSWSELAERLHEMFAIPIDKLDVTYIDNYNDLTRDITVCSNEDLEICHSRKKSAQILEFDVFDSSNLAIRRGPFIGVLLNNCRISRLIRLTKRASCR